MNAWQDDAACQGMDVVEFFGPDGERAGDREFRESLVKLVCAECPVRRDCLNHALRQPERDGVWGGLNEHERAVVVRRRRDGLPDDPQAVERAWTSRELAEKALRLKDASGARRTWEQVAELLGVTYDHVRNVVDYHRLRLKHDTAAEVVV